MVTDKSKQQEYLHLSSYIEQFANLNIKNTSNGIAPHKPILLLSVIRLIESGNLVTNRIWPDDIIKDEFESNWRKYVPADNVYKSWVWKPYWHMKNEPFWHLKPIVPGFKLDSLVDPGQTASLGSIKEHVRYAYLDEQLFDLLQYDVNRLVLSRLLIDTYLN